MTAVADPAAVTEAPASTWRRAVRFAWEELRVGLPLCVAAAAFISLLFRESFTGTLIYSLCIGLTIQLLIEAGRHGIAAALRRRDPQHLPADSGWPGWAWMAPWTAGAAVLGYFAGSRLADWLTGAQRTHLLTDESHLHALTLILVISLAMAFGAVFFFHSRGRMDSLQAQAEAAQRRAAEAQLMLLQSQLEPHMLFNTLANLRVLIGSDPPRAQAMLDHLIAFLRATLGASRRTLQSLADEFDRVHDYLELMTLRMGPRLTVRSDLPAALRALPVPSLVLQPLVENSIRHGLEPQVAGGRIELAARRDGDALVLSVRDTGVGLGHHRAAAHGGRRFGLEQVRSRLAALFGARASLTLRDAPDAEGGTLAELRLPWPAANVPANATAQAAR
ncbi:MAG: histidine kinase [Ideonella sp.]|nr:histidine kinase [Ideonella sp.]MCC7455681.1 histidine kinase [Nitrospira sp.]